jgi:hypothetical protein
VDDSSRKKFRSSSLMERWDCCWNCWREVKRRRVSKRESEVRIFSKWGFVTVVVPVFDGDAYLWREVEGDGDEWPRSLIDSLAIIPGSIEASFVESAFSASDSVSEDSSSL